MLRSIYNFTVNAGRWGLKSGSRASLFFVQVNNVSRLFWAFLSTIHLIFKNFFITTRQMYMLGIESIPLVLSVSIFVGAEVVIQAVYQFSGIIPLRYLGLAVCKSLLREFCPVITSIVVSGRIATSMAAEIGNMKTTEQIDAMHCLNLDPIRYLVVPKTIASMFMMPVLVIFSELIAIVASILTVIFFIDMTLFEFVSSMKARFFLEDALVGVVKAFLFGGVVGIIGCHFGFEAEKGAKGIGNAASSATMIACALIFIIDFIVAYLLM